MNRANLRQVLDCACPSGAFLSAAPVGRSNLRLPESLGAKSQSGRRTAAVQNAGARRRVHSQCAPPAALRLRRMCLAKGARRITLSVQLSKTLVSVTQHSTLKPLQGVPRFEMVLSNIWTEIAVPGPFWDANSPCQHCEAGKIDQCGRQRTKRAQLVWSLL